MKQTFRAVSIFLVFFCLATMETSAQRVVPEEEVKSAYLFNFIKFVTWPEQSFDSATAPYVIGIYGKDPFGPTLDKVVGGKAVNERPIVVKRLTSLGQATRCHILYLGSFKESDINQVLSAVKGHPVLTVSDIDPFARQGGMIQFVKQGAKIRLQVNPGSAGEESLKISSNLLRLSDLVSTVK